MVASYATKHERTYYRVYHRWSLIRETPAPFGAAIALRSQLFFFWEALDGVTTEDRFQIIEIVGLRLILGHGGFEVGVASGPGRKTGKS